MPPTIGVMVKVDDADALVKRASTLGGRALPAFDVMDQGRMAVCFDPAGAAIDVWQPKPGKGQGTDVDPRQHGATTWFETLTTDVERATKFYTGMFGWKTQPKPMPGFTYTVFLHGETHIGGLMPILPHMGPMKAHWATYFAVRNADDAARTAVKLGGKVHVPAQDIPDVGRFCGIISPQGVAFFVLEYENTAPEKKARS
jgi:predicted enzyme related to lactoylglutathione lyase